MTEIPESDLKYLKQRVTHWLENGGKEEIDEAVKRSEKAIKLFHESARVDYRTLDKPCTI